MIHPPFTIDTHSSCRRNRRDGFTLVELLVVIGIIGLLLGILLPTLSRARQHASMLRELAACRQLLTAYGAYHQDHRGALLPGHTSDDKIRVYDNFGRIEVTGEPVKRWPWRLLAATRYSPLGSILIGERADTLSAQGSLTVTIESGLYQYMVSLTPSFGYNFYGLGGDLTLSNGQYVPTAVTSHCVRKATRVTSPSTRIVFTSARGLGVEGNADGYWKIVPPNSFPYEYGTAWSPDPFSHTKPPEAWGYVHPRHRNKAVVGFFDGHCDTLTLIELRDMRHWIEAAQKSGDPNWSRPE